MYSTPWGGGQGGCKITGKDSNGAVFADTYAEGSAITITAPNGGTTKFKCVNGSWVLQARVSNPRRGQRTKPPRRRSVPGDMSPPPRERRTR